MHPNQERSCKSVWLWKRTQHICVLINNLHFVEDRRIFQHASPSLLRPVRERLWADNGKLGDILCEKKNKSCQTTQASTILFFFHFRTNISHTMMQTTPEAANTKEFSRNNWWFCGQGRINEACTDIIMKAASASKQIAIGMAGVKANRFHGSVPDVVYFEDSMALPDWNTLGELLESEETTVLIATTCVPDRLMISAAPGEYKRILQSNLVDIRYVPPGCTFCSDFEAKYFET